MNELSAEVEFEEKVRAVIAKIRPFIQGDGGDIELVRIVDKSAEVRLMGACQGCPGSLFTLKLGLEQALKDEIPEFEEVIPVD